MRLRTLVALLLFVGGVTGGAAVMHAAAVPPARWAVVTYDYPVKVGNVVLVGTCLIVHDDAKMARGEPCTSIYRIQSTGHPELMISFTCVPSQRSEVAKFTTVVSRSALGTTLLKMVAYQFAGESEAHGVPVALNGN